MSSALSFQPEFVVTELTSPEQVSSLDIPFSYLQQRQHQLLQPIEENLMKNEDVLRFTSALLSIGFNLIEIQELLYYQYRYVRYQDYGGLLSSLFFHLEQNYYDNSLIFDFPEYGTSGLILESSDTFRYYSRRNTNWSRVTQSTKSRINRYENPLHILVDDAVYKGETTGFLRKRIAPEIVVVPLTTQRGARYLFDLGVQKIITCMQIPVETYALIFNQKIRELEEESGMYSGINRPYPSDLVCLPHTRSDTCYMFDYLFDRFEYKRRTGFYRRFRPRHY